MQPWSPTLGCADGHPIDRPNPRSTQGAAGPGDVGSDRPHLISTATGLKHQTSTRETFREDLSTAIAVLLR
jgi:hypothetical protein